MLAIYWAWGLPLGVACIFSETLVEKTNLSLVDSYQSEMAGLGMGACVYFPPSLDVQGPVHGASVSVVYVCQSCCVQKTLFSWCLSSPLDLIIFLPLLPRSFLSPGGRDLMEASHLGLGVSKALILSFQSWAFVLVTIYHWGKLLWWWMVKTLICGCKTMLLGVVSLLRSFGNTIVFGFP